MSSDFIDGNEKPFIIKIKSKDESSTFAISVLQCFLSFPHLMKYINDSKTVLKNNLIKEFKKNLQSNFQDPVKIIEIIKSIGKQRENHLERLINELKEQSKPFGKCLFNGTLATFMECQNCQISSNRNDTSFSIVDLPLVSAVSTSTFKRTKKLTLENLFELFSKPKATSKKNCEYCNRNSYFIDRKDLSELPKILILQINQFNDPEYKLVNFQIPEFAAFYNDTDGFKEMKTIKDPKLYVTNKSSKDEIYELRALINQNDQKDFYSIVKRAGKWYNCNRSIDEIDISDITNVPYILFYEIVDDINIVSTARATENNSPAPNLNNIPVAYDYKGKPILAPLKRDMHKNSNEIIDFLRKRINSETVSGFKYNGKIYNYGDYTDINDIFPTQNGLRPKIELIFQTNPPSRPTPPPNRGRTRPQQHSSAFTVEDKKNNVSLAILDYSASMIACLNDSGIRRSEVATKAINTFLQAGRVYCYSDIFKFFDEFKEKTNCRYDKELFKSPSSLLDSLKVTVNHLNKKYSKDKYQYRRILIVTDCVFPLNQQEEERHNKINLFEEIIENQIIIDIIFLKNNSEEANDFYAISHYSGGYACCPNTPDDVYKFIENEDFINLSLRKILPLEFRCNEFNIDRFESMSKFAKLTTKPNKINQFFYTDMTLVSPFADFEELKTDRTDDRIKRIIKEIDICAYNQKSNQYYSIYRILNNANQIDKEKAVVFLKSKKFLLQFMIFFPELYPNEIPMFKLLSNAKIDIDDESELSNFLFRFNDPDFSSETKLKKLLKKLSNELDNFNIKSLETDYIDSFEQIDSKFTIEYGTQQKTDTYFRNLDKSKRY